MVKYNKTATFLFPLLEIPKKLFTCDVRFPWGRLRFDQRFLNAFMTDAGISKYKENHIFVACRNYRDVHFDGFYNALQSFPNYVDDYEKNGLLVMVYTIPEHNMEDYLLLVNGKYSEIKESTKQLILANNFFSGPPHTIPLILYKTEMLKKHWETVLSNEGSEVDLGDQEVWPIIDQSCQVLTDEIASSLTGEQKLMPSGEFE